MKLRQLSSRLAQSAFLVPFLLISFLPASAAERNTKSPTCDPPNPNADFLTNFNKPCFTVSLINGDGLNYSGDSNATYDAIYYQVQAGYELVLLGEYPNGRFMSVTVYDEHLAITSSVPDMSILPLNSSMMNPYEVGAHFALNPQYGITIGFGSPLTTTPNPGCSASDTTIDQNFLDASQIHPGLTWAGYAGTLPVGFPAHQTGANSSGLLMVRKYLAIANNVPETIMVRSTSTGCAIPASQALSSGILNLTQGLSSTTYLNQGQIAAHQEFSDSIEDLQCYNPDPNASKQWFRTVDYVPLANMGASLDLNLTTTNMAPLLSGQEFVRIRFVAPTVPNIPCASGNCTLTGNEDLRYYSISFLGASTPDGKTTLTSLSDTQFTQDPNGNVTLLVGLGAQPPSFVTGANYYTYLDLTQVPNYTSLTRIEIRNILPNINFTCSNANVPNFTMAYNNVGGFLGQYLPTADFPTAATLTYPAPPGPNRPNTCAVQAAPPVACGPSQPLP